MGILNREKLENFFKENSKNFNVIFANDTCIDCTLSCLNSEMLEKISIKNGIMLQHRQNLKRVAIMLGLDFNYVDSQVQIFYKTGRLILIDFLAITLFFMLDPVLFVFLAELANNKKNATQLALFASYFGFLLIENDENFNYYSLFLHPRWHFLKTCVYKKTFIIGVQVILQQLKLPDCFIHKICVNYKMINSNDKQIVPVSVLFFCGSYCDPKFFVFLFVKLFNSN